jgi:hypothetical protein
MVNGLWAIGQPATNTIFIPNDPQPSINLTQPEHTKLKPIMYEGQNVKKYE